MNQPKEAFTIWDPETPLPSTADLRIPDRITHIILHRGDNNFRFLHESAIEFHDGRFFAAWNNSPEAESERGSVARWISAEENFTSWTEPQPLAPPLNHETTIWESCQLLSLNNELWAFVGQVHTQPREPEETGGAMTIFRFNKTGRQWQEQGRVDGFHPINKPQPTKDGNWIMGGQFNLVRPKVAVSAGSDLTKWTVKELPSDPEDKINFAETSLVVAGNIITAHIRSARQTVYVSESADNGQTWSPVQPGNLPMASSKTCAGMFSNGSRYLAFNMKPEEQGDRDTLVLAVSASGEKLFKKIVPIRNGKAPTARVQGFCKRAQWSYPSVLEHSGNVYISYSVTKEDCCLSILPLSEFDI